MTDLLYSDIEEQLRKSVRDLLADRAPWTEVLRRLETAQPYDPALWQALAGNIGVAGLAVAEQAGGQGASWREAAVVAEELGRAVAGTPFLGSSVLATVVASCAGASDLLAGLADGTQTAAVAVAMDTAPGDAFPSAVAASASGTLTGAVRNVVDARTADHLLVPAVGPGGPAVYRVDASAAVREDVVSFDLTRPLSDLAFEAVPAQAVAEGEDARAALEAALVTGAAILASEQLGLAQQCLDTTVDYLKTRYQFARPLGSYQALKHRVADLWAAVTQARALARYAADCAATEDPDTPVAAAMAQSHCSQTAVRAAEECVQLHGGIGFTWEHPAHLYLKRAKADAILLGTPRRHRARLATLVDLPAATV
ncbi:MAG TPA: acyl-CoA dehydrogenase family protein [Actinocrinis sp.]|jgi:alkylation response protein AidB-like acyl-CoA dehydrogenase